MNVFRIEPKYFFLLLILTLSGCNRKIKEKTDIGVNLLKIDWESVSDVADYSSMVEDSVLIIALDTTNAGLIGEVTKLVYQNDLIYIADNLTKSVFVFDMSGKLQHKIHAAGNGPGEYINISYFTVHVTDLVILDHYQNKLLFYNKSGKFIRDKHIGDIWGTDLFCIDNKLYLPNNNSGSKSGYYHLYSIDLDNSDHLGKYLPFDEPKTNLGWSIDSYYAQCGNEALLCFCPYDELYTVKNGDIYLSYKIDFGVKRLPKQYIEGDGTIALRTAIRNNYVVGLRKFWQSAQYLFLYFADSENDYISIYNKVTGEMQTTKHLQNAKMGDLLLQPNGEGFIIQNEQIIQCYNADYWNFPGNIERLKSSDTSFYTEELRQKFLKLAQSDGTELNPIILIQKLKK